MPRTSEVLVGRYDEARCVIESVKGSGVSFGCDGVMGEGMAGGGYSSHEVDSVG